MSVESQDHLPLACGASAANRGPTYPPRTREGYRGTAACRLASCSAAPAGDRPRPAEFLAGVEGPEREDLLGKLLRLLAVYLPREQRRRWLDGERVSVREFLREMPELRHFPSLQ